MFTHSIEKAKSGDMSAFSTLYDASYDRVYRYVFHRTLDTIVTEDIISDIYMKVLKGIQKFRGNTEGEYYAWVFQIAYTTIVDASREVQVDSLDEIIWEPSYEEEGILDAKDKLEEVIAYLKTLSEKEQRIVTMRIWDDLTYEEIADITGESITNIRKIFSRTLAKISANVSTLSLILLFIHHVWKV